MLTKLETLAVGSQLANWKDLALKDVRPGASQVLPVNGNQRLVGFLGVSDNLGDAVLMPQPLNLLVTLQTQMEGIPTPTQRNRLKRKVMIRINRHSMAILLGLISSIAC